MVHMSMVYFKPTTSNKVKLHLHYEIDLFMQYKQDTNLLQTGTQNNTICNSDDNLYCIQRVYRPPSFVYDMFLHTQFYTYIDPICIWVVMEFTINLRVDTQKTHISDRKSSAQFETVWSIMRTNLHLDKVHDICMSSTNYEGHGHKFNLDMLIISH